MLNKVMLIGNLGADPETRHTANGGEICNINVATSERWKDKSGERQERTEWHRVVMFGALAGIAAKYLNKGSKVYLEGRIQTRKWQDKDGSDRYSTEVVANEMKMLDGKADKPARTDSQRSQDAQRPPGGGGQTVDDLNDDIPFVVAMTTQHRP